MHSGNSFKHYIFRPRCPLSGQEITIVLYVVYYMQYTTNEVYVHIILSNITEFKAHILRQDESEQVIVPVFFSHSSLMINQSFVTLTQTADTPISCLASNTAGATRNIPSEWYNYQSILYNIASNANHHGTYITSVDKLQLFDSGIELKQLSFRKLNIIIIINLSI